MLCARATPSHGAVRGTVKWFDVKKGYWLQCLRPHVVHAVGFGSLGKGEAVAFEVRQCGARYRLYLFVVWSQSAIVY